MHESPSASFLPRPGLSGEGPLYHSISLKVL